MEGKKMVAFDNQTWELLEVGSQTNTKAQIGGC